MGTGLQFLEMLAGYWTVADTTDARKNASGAPRRIRAIPGNR